MHHTAIQRVQQETGMGHLQAFHHLKQREVIATMPNPYPLGKNNSVDHDAEYAEWAKRYPDLAAQHVV